MLDLDLIQKEYGFMGDTVFLNVSQVVVPPKRVQDAYRKFMDDYVSNFGIDIVSRAWDIVNNTRPKLQKLINAKESHEIAFVKNTAEGISILANGIKYNEGDNIVIADQEHQSILFPWIAARERYGIELKVVKSIGTDVETCAKILMRHDGYVAMNLDGGTSAVMWYDGEYVTKCSNTSIQSRSLPNAWVYGNYE